jgi:D-alanyl-D-alanine carboxypeptidase
MRAARPAPKVIMPNFPSIARRHRAVALSLLFVWSPAAVLAAQAPSAARTRATEDTVDRIIRAEMAKSYIPGLALAVVRGGRVVKRVGYGTADLEHGIPVTPQTAFKIGSLSKQFLAAGILLLQQDGKLSVDDPVAKHLAGTPATWNAVTLRTLLTHTSGILREGPAFNPGKVQPDSVVVASAYSEALLFPTGSRFEYCNVCYFALADIIARRSGKPWNLFFAERVFAPLKMSATRTTTTHDLVPHRARGYVWERDRYANADEYLALRPSGAFLSTLEDLITWNAALDSDRLLSASSRQAMWTPAALTSGEHAAYGFGWRIDAVDGHSRIHHGGSLPGFRAEIARFPSDSLTVIILTNADGANPDAIARSVARTYWR